MVRSVAALMTNVAAHTKYQACSGDLKAQACEKEHASLSYPARKTWRKYIVSQDPSCHLFLYLLKLFPLLPFYTLLFKGDTFCIFSSVPYIFQFSRSDFHCEGLPHKSFQINIDVCACTVCVKEYILPILSWEFKCLSDCGRCTVCRLTNSCWISFDVFIRCFVQQADNWPEVLPCTSLLKPFFDCFWH